MPRLARLGVTACILLSDGLALACSGPGAADAIVNAEILGWALFAGGLSFAAGLVFLRRRRTGGLRGQWLLFVPAIAHPGWWMSARGGDCGRTLVAGSIAMTVLTVLGGAFVLWRSRRRPANP